MKKWLMIYCIIFLSFNYFYNTVHAQYFTSGNEPFSVRWRSIETEKLKVIFPSSMDSIAGRFVNMVESFYPHLSKTMTPISAKMPVIFHNQNVLSNGFVTWAPKRMEIFTTPSRDHDAQDWMQGMTLHEYRHVLQVDRLNTGFTRFFRLFTGQTGIGLPVTHIPLWFNEGDAIIAETMFGPGRGTLPSFEMPFKAYVLESDESLSYDKSYFGSLKNFVPDYYKMGYFVVGYSRLKYNKDIWNQTIHLVGKFPLMPFALNSSLKRNYGTTSIKLFHEAIDTLKNIWNNQYKDLHLTNYSKIIFEKPKSYTSYHYPHLTKDGSIIAYKSSIDDLDKIVRLEKNGKETVLHVPGNVYEARLSCGENLVAWDEVVSDLRWHQRNYSVIKTLNLTNGKVKTLTTKSRYFSPCISPDERKIVLAETDLTNNSSLVLIETEEGKEIFKVSSPQKGLMNYPVWYDLNTIVLIFTTTEQGKMIYLYDLIQNMWSAVIEPSFVNISQLAVWNNHILFSAGYSGIDNIYALNVSRKELYQITSSRFGAFYPFVYQNCDTIYYSEYTSNGYIPVKTELNPDNWIPFADINYTKTEWGEQLIQQESGGSNKPVLKDTTYISKRYSRFRGLINIHSWAPFYVEPQFDSPADAQIKPGVIVLSQNLLNSSISSLGLSYENKNLIFRPTFTYSGFYPVIDFSSKIGGKGQRLPLPRDVIPADSIYPYVDFYLRSYLPFRIFNNKYYKYIVPEIDIEYENTLYYEKELRKGIFFLHYRLLLYRYLKLSRQDIYPRWGQLISLTYTNSPFEKTQYGSLMSGNVTFYLPGFFRHHSIGIRGGIQYQNLSNKKYFYSFNRITLPRGYSGIIDVYFAETMTKFTIDYSLPLIYPDLSLGSLMYIKRLRTGLFSDYGYGYNVREYKDNFRTVMTGMYYSCGFDLISDMHLFRFIFPFSLGIRISYVPIYRQVNPEMLFYIDTSVF